MTIASSRILDQQPQCGAFPTTATFPASRLSLIR